MSGCQDDEGITQPIRKRPRPPLQISMRLPCRCNTLLCNYIRRS